MPLNYRKRC